MEEIKVEVKKSEKVEKNEEKIIKNEKKEGNKERVEKEEKIPELKGKMSKYEETKAIKRKEVEESKRKEVEESKREPQKKEGFKLIMQREIEREKYIPTTYDDCRLDLLKGYNIGALAKIREKVPIKTILVTCTFTPEYEFKEAWKTMIIERTKVIEDLMEKYKEIKFTISTIEHHHNIGEKMKEGIERMEEKKVEVKKVEVKGAKAKKERVRKAGSLYAAYTKRTMKEMEEEIKKYRIDEQVWKSMDQEEKIVTYYNVLQNLHYLNGESNREKKYKKWISKEQEAIGKKLKNEKNMKEKIEWTEIEKKLITKHKEIGNNLLGYPHMHIAVAYAGIIDQEKFIREINAYIHEKKLYPNPQVDKTKAAKSIEEGKGLMYVMKNHKNGYVRRVLDENDDRGAIVRIHINETGENWRYREYAEGLITSEKRNKYGLLVTDIYEKGQEGKEEEKKEKEKEIDPEKNGYARTAAAIIKEMKEKELKICDGKIYQKLEGTKRTYVHFGEIETLVNYITAEEPLNTIAIRWKGEIINMMKMKKEDEDKMDKLKIGEGGYRVKFEKIELDYRTIECKNFYFNTITSEIYKEQEKYYCHYYAPLKLEELEENLKRYEREGKWIKIIRNSKQDKPEVYAILHSTLRPVAGKGTSGLLFGPSNAGKTLVMAAFKKYYPEGKVTTMVGKITDHHTADLGEGAVLIIWDEANQLLNNKLTRSQALIALGGEEGVSDKKHGTIKNMIYKAVIVSLTNVDGKDVYMDDMAITNRMVIIGPMIELKEEYTMTDIIEEQPYIYLYTGLQFMKLGKENGEEIKMFKINEKMTEEHIKEIEEMKIYYSKENKEQIDIFSKEYREEREITKRIREEDSRRMKKYQKIKVNGLLELMEARKNAAEGECTTLERIIRMQRERRTPQVKQIENRKEQVKQIEDKKDEGNILKGLPERTKVNQ